MAEKTKTREVKSTPSGTGIVYHIDYEYSIKDKCMVPVLSKPIDQYAMIQASKSSCDINVILNRAKAGDISVLNVNPNAAYTDISEVPDNLNDAHEAMQRAKDNWNNLPEEARAIFNNDYMVMAEAVEKGTYNQIMQDYFEAVKNAKLKAAAEAKQEGGKA